MNLPVDTLLHGGTYKIIRFINSGGFGCTYEAEHLLLGERVAIKEFFVKDFCNRNETTFEITVGTLSKKPIVDKLRKKFIDEARVLYRFNHPGIVNVSDVFEENGTAYYVMDYIEGTSLDKVVEQRGALPESEALDYIRQVADALRYVHGQNRLHLDIKPGNIMLSKAGRAILIDFGTSKHYDEETGQNTTTLTGIHTPGYAPLEQISHSFTAFEPTVDIYALGATLYKLLTGMTPPPANQLATRKHTLSFPDSIGTSTRQAITSAMQTDNEDRPQSVDEFLKILEGKLGVEKSLVNSLAKDKTVVESDNKEPEVKIVSTPVTPPTPPTPHPEKKGNGKWILLGTAVLLLLVVGFFIGRGGGGEEPTPVLDPDTLAQVDYAEQSRQKLIADSLRAVRLQAKEDSLAQVKKELEQRLDDEKAKQEAEQAKAEAEDGARIARAEQERKAEEERARKQREEEEERKRKEAEAKAQPSPQELFQQGKKHYDAKEYTQAVPLFRQAAEQGHSDAQCNLGFCYYDGEGVEKDYTQAVYWYRKAAEQGYAGAQHNLGNCYYNGWGVEKDYTQAVYWYRKAAEQGHAGAKDMVKQLENMGY